MVLKIQMKVRQLSTDFSSNKKARSGISDVAEIP
jgi:hypothetical protein